MSKMKLTLQILTFVLIISVIIPIPQKANAIIHDSTPIVWSEGFETYPIGESIGGQSGWTVLNGNATISNQESLAGSKNLYVDGRSQLKQESLNLDRGAISFWLKPTSLETSFKIEGLGPDGSLFQIEKVQSDLYYTDINKKYPTNLQLSAEKWYRFLIIYQTTAYTKKYQLIITDQNGKELGKYNHLNFMNDQQLEAIKFEVTSKEGLLLDEIKYMENYTYETYDFDQFSLGSLHEQAVFTSSESVVVTSETAATGTQSIQLQGKEQFMEGTIGYMSHYSMEWYWKWEDDQSKAFHLYANNESGEKVWEIGINEDSQYVSDGPNHRLVENKQLAGSWYKVRVDADLSTGTYDITVWDENDVQVFRITDLKTSTPSPSTPTFTVESTKENKATLWIDHITIYPNGGFHTLEGFDFIHNQLDYGMDHNENGKLAWGNSFINDAYLYMYRATNDTKYLDIVIEELDKMIEQRDHERKVKDWKGKLEKGWATAGRYNLGEKVIDDNKGNSVLKIKSVRNGDQNGGTRFSADNDSIRIEINDGSEEDLFQIRIFSNTLRMDNTYDNVSLDPNHERFIETIINGTDPLVAVWQLGDGNSKPANGIYSLDIGRYHTLVDHGRISQAYAAFARIVHEDPTLQKDKYYRKKAKNYQKVAEDAVKIFDPYWRENDQGEGWYIFEPGAPFWADGVDEPHNRYMALGHTMLDLYAVTGKKHYLDKVTKIAQSFKNDLIYDEENDLYLWTYARTKGHFYNGWPVEEGVSRNTQSFAGSRPLEDVSHARIELTFVYWAMKDGIVFNETDLQRFANTFKKNVVQPDGTTAYRLDGSGAQSYNPWTSGWLVLAEVDPDMYYLIKDIFDREQTLFFPSYIYGSAKLNWVNSKILDQ